ncbi:MAG: IclR family transcriptional regulator [Eubacteriales bacterium]|nr:IclR family transcriptional regulator [Eubacteriales bacterium]
MKTAYQPKHPIGTLEKAIEILTYLKDHAFSDGVSIGSISDGTGIGKSGVHRYLDTLLEYDYVSKNENGTKYRLSWGAYELGCNIPKMNGVDSRGISEQLHSLCNEIGYIVNLGIESEQHMMIIKRFFPERPNRKHMLITDVSIGVREPLHCTGIGKLFLAAMDEREALSIFEAEPEKNKALTKYTLRDEETLLQEIKKIRECGYAFDRMEASEEVFCVAAPIFDCSGCLVSGISISVPSAYAAKENMESLGETMKRAAREISKSMGWNPKL